MTEPHSITRHPLASEPYFPGLCWGVQFARISWPIGIELDPEPIQLQPEGTAGDCGTTYHAT